MKHGSDSHGRRFGTLLHLVLSYPIGPPALQHVVWHDGKDDVRGRALGEAAEEKIPPGGEGESKVRQPSPFGSDQRRSVNEQQRSGRHEVLVANPAVPQLRYYHFSPLFTRFYFKRHVTSIISSRFCTVRKEKNSSLVDG